MQADLTSTLTPNERLRKNQLEAKIRIHLRSFWEAGEALFEICESRLYRDEYTTFENYCDDKWGFSDRRARQLMFASKVVNEIAPGGTMVPVVTERAIREFSPLQPNEYQQTWKQVLEEANGGRITASLVKRVVRAATDVAIEAVQAQSVSIGNESIPLIEASITEKMAESQYRQTQHIADGSDWDRRTTFTCTVGEAAEMIEQKVIGLGSDVEIKISMYTRKVAN